MYSIILPSLTSCQLPTVNHHTILFTHCQLSPISVTLLSIIPPLLIVFLTLSRCLLLQARWLRNHHGWWENLVWRNQDTTLESSCLSSHSLQVDQYLILYFFYLITVLPARLKLDMNCEACEASNVNNNEHSKRIVIT